MLRRCLSESIFALKPSRPLPPAIQRDGVTVLLVEQDVQIALSGADRGYVMETGRVVLSGSAKALIDDPAVQQAYLGL